MHNFLMLIYLDFFKGSVENYDVKKMYRLLNESYGYNDTIRIVSGDQVFEYQKRECNRSTLIIEMEKSDVAKGRYLLSEFRDLYLLEYKFEDLMTALWIDFIEKYKRGRNEKSLKSIIKMLKNIQKN